MAEDLEQEIRDRVEALGYELVELERAGSRSRPILRVRVDLPGSSPDEGVTVDDCTRVSRALETYLDELEPLSDRYVLEVSSPGLERPLVRTADFERFAGREVVVKTTAKLPDGSKRVEGELVGLDIQDGVERVRVRRIDGSEVDIPREDIARAHLIFRWNDRR
jgi:ribosome maturation factor RimP